MIIKAGQVTEEELVKQIDHISKIRGDTGCLSVLKVYLPPATTLLIVHHSFFFFLTNYLEIRFLSSPFSASSGDSTHLFLNRYTLWSHMVMTMVRATNVGGLLPSLSSSLSRVFLPTTLRYRLFTLPIIQMQKLRQS